MIKMLMINPLQPGVAFLYPQICFPIKIRISIVLSTYDEVWHFRDASKDQVIFILIALLKFLKKKLTLNFTIKTTTGSV